MGAQHTPGPWVYRHEEDEGHYEISALSGREVIGQVFYVDNAPSSRGEADARLIAEAPAMLAALQKAERFFGGFEGDTEILDDPIDDDLAEIRAIIARATGAA